MGKKIVYYLSLIISSVIAFILSLPVFLSITTIYYFSNFYLTGSLIIILSVLSTILFIKGSHLYQKIKLIFFSIEPKKEILSKVIASFLILFGVSAVIMLSVNIFWQIKINKLKKEMKSLGLKTSTSEYQENYPSSDYLIPDFTEEKKDIFKKIIGDIDLKFFENTDKHYLSEIKKWDKDTYQKAHKITLFYEPLLTQKIYPLLSKYKRHAQINYIECSKNPISCPTPRYADWVIIAKIMKNIAIDYSYKEDFSKSFNTIEKMLILSDLISTDNFMVSKMVSIIINRFAAETCLNIMINSPSVKFPQNIEERFKTILKKELIKDGVKVGLTTLFNAYQIYPHSKLFIEDGGPLLDRILNRFLGIICMVTGSFNASFYEVANNYFIVIQNKYIGTKNQYLTPSFPFWPYLFGQVIIPNWKGFFEKEAEMKTKIKMGLILSSMAEYYKSNKSYPQKLSELAPKFIEKDILIDYFSDDFYLYEVNKNKKGFKICSAGVNKDKKTLEGGEFCINQKI
jgi:hypothetical protein